MTWTCSCDHPNPDEAGLCLACGSPRPRPGGIAPPAGDARFRTIETPRAWRAVIDSVSLYLRVFLGFLTASVLMYLPQLLLRSWQLRAEAAGVTRRVGSVLLAGILFAAWNSFWLALMVRMAADEIEGGSKGIGGAVARLTPAIVIWAVVAQFLITMATAVATLFFIIPGIIIGVRLSLTLPAVVCEGLGPISAMKRSFRLVKGHTWSVLGALLLVLLATFASFVTVSVVTWVANGPFSTTENLLKTWILGRNTFVQALIMPFWAIVPTLFYASFRSKLDSAEALKAASVRGDEP